MHGHTVALILHHPQCRYLKICHVLYLHALCRDTKGPRPFYQVYSLATFFLADSIVNPSSACEPNGYWTGATEDASLKNMNWQVLLMCFSYF